MERGALHRRVLFETWLEAHRNASATLALAGEPIDRRRFLARVASLAGQQRDGEYVYLLMERRPSEETPAYIGRAVSPMRRWIKSFHVEAKERVRRPPSLENLEEQRS